MTLKLSLAFLAGWLVVELTGSTCHALPMSPLDDSRRVQGGVQTPPPVHNVTVNCPPDAARLASHCLTDLERLSHMGYPWHPYDIKRNEQKYARMSRGNDIVDPLDALGNLCHVLRRSDKCLQENAIPDACLILLPDYTFYKQINFRFLCGRRDTSLIRSLTCLHEHRLLTTLYYRMGQRYSSGMDILDQLMAAKKNVIFYTLNVEPLFAIINVPLLYCLPEAAVSEYVWPIIEDQCGNETATLVSDFIRHIQTVQAGVLLDAGLNPDLCHYQVPVSSDGHVRVSGSGKYVLSDFSRMPNSTQESRKEALKKFVTSSFPGTAADTVKGRGLADELQTIETEDICHQRNVYITYAVCLLASDEIQDRGKFNLLQFAHQQLGFYYHGSHCGSLDQFKACWNLLKETCNPQTRGLVHHALLFIEGCEIQNEMDDISCPWQDFLLGRYLKVSGITPWPMATQRSENPLYLQSAYLAHPGDAIQSLQPMFNILLDGVDEIGRRCDAKVAERLRGLYKRLSYAVFDTFKLIQWLDER